MSDCFIVKRMDGLGMVMEVITETHGEAEDFCEARKRSVDQENPYIIEKTDRTILMHNLRIIQRFLGDPDAHWDV